MGQWLKSLQPPFSSEKTVPFFTLHSRDLCVLLQTDPKLKTFRDFWNKSEERILEFLLYLLHSRRRRERERESYGEMWGEIASGVCGFGVS